MYYDDGVILQIVFLKNIYTVRRNYEELKRVNFSFNLHSTHQFNIKRRPIQLTNLRKYKNGLWTNIFTSDCSHGSSPYCDFRDSKIYFEMIDNNLNISEFIEAKGDVFSI